MLTQTNPSLSTIAAILPDGFVVPYVEVANTAAQRIAGLSDRIVGPRQGMIFSFGRRGFCPMHMDECVVQIDMIWLDRDLMVRHAVTATPNRSNTRWYDRTAMSWHVLELAAGQASAHGVVPGSQIRFTVTP